MEVACGAGHVCVRTSRRTVRCWGNNDVGQLGDGLSTHQVCTDEEATFDCSHVPVDVVGVDDAVQIAAGGVVTCVRRVTGAVACWGFNGLGQLGDGTQVTRSVPTTVVDIEGVVDISVGEFHACAVRADSTVWCWGRAVGGSLGSGASTPDSCGGDTSEACVRPTRLPAISDAVQVSAGLFGGCARRASGEVWCWGRNGHVTGAGNGAPADPDVPAAVDGLADAASVYSGYLSTCAVLVNGEVRCLGPSYGHEEVSRTLRSIEGLGGPVSTVTGGWSHLCALLEDGRVRCWGENDYGQLGNGGTEPSDEPVSPADL
ncbi:MAG: hypothetical protein IT379_19035 [Deltaproteobacteria bacterium]|nr:hypothetical protein [Deltaproteobacteria bacterium]